MTRRGSMPLLYTTRCLAATRIHPLPMVGGPATLSMTPSVDPKLPSRAARVLLAEDDAFLRRGLSLALGAAGLAVKGVATVGEALEAIERERWDAIVTDLALGHASGLEIVRSIRRSAPETPVLIMTGHATSETAAEALREGALDYLVKPI